MINQPTFHIGCFGHGNTIWDASTFITVAHVCKDSTCACSENWRTGERMTSPRVTIYKNGKENGDAYLISLKKFINEIAH
jgi:hypothetical protein